MIRPGSLLISHPHWARDDFIDSILFITEHTPHSTVALQLNKPTNTGIRELVEQQGYSTHLNDLVYRGGDYNSTALIMLHESSWFSSNTMPVNSDWSISSDHFMIEKLCEGNLPLEYRCVIGISGWEPGELDRELNSKKPKWLLLKNPPLELITAKYNEQYQLAVNLVSQRLTAQYF